MAFFRCDVMSESLGMATSVLVTIPDTGDLAAAPVVYLLHGLTDNCTGWLRYTQAEHLARTHGAILIVPEVQRSFYTDMACGPKYFTYINQELPTLCRRFFGIQPVPERTYIMGLSMGGYGAMKCAFTAPQQYAGCAGFSSVAEIQAELPQLCRWHEDQAIFPHGIVPPQDDLFELVEKFRDGTCPMADAVTDPRWQRTYGTFGEDPALISEIMAHIIPRIQGSDHGVTEDGVAVTTKHFPGGGARENGFDPHYAAGQWNVYATPGSLETYHLPPFAAAVKAGTSSIMPYYSKPAAAKSAVQHDLAGNTVEMKPYGFAYNKYFIDTMLRGQMGFDGYINSDTGIAHNMAWGVEMLDVPERIGFAVANAGVDIISGLFDNEAGMEAYNRGKNGYYETHPLPEGFAKEELTLTDEALNRAVARTLTELFALGMFENPYRDPDEAARIVATPSDWEAAADAHRRSVVLLKNDGALPLTADKRANKKIYAEAFLKNAKHAADSTAALRKELADTCTLVDDPAQADFALLFVSPSSGEYFNATPGYLELDICEDKTVCNVDANGKPMADTHTETTLHGGKRLAEIAASVHANGGKVITNVNITLAWQLGNVEPLCDVLLAGFDTYRSATLDVIFGCFAPTGKLPLTLPRGDAVLAVNADGVCISPNDVPGYDKDRYMPDSLKDENGKAYAYRDAAGNYYEYGFGLEG